MNIIYMVETFKEVWITEFTLFKVMVLLVYCA